MKASHVISALMSVLGFGIGLRLDILVQPCTVRNILSHTAFLNSFIFPWINRTDTIFKTSMRHYSLKMCRYDSFLWPSIPIHARVIDRIRLGRFQTFTTGIGPHSIRRSISGIFRFLLVSGKPQWLRRKELPYLEIMCTFRILGRQSHVCSEVCARAA